MVRSLSLKNNGLQKVCKLANFKSQKMLSNRLINRQFICYVQLYGRFSDYLLNYLQVQQNRSARIVTMLDKCTEKKSASSTGGMAVCTAIVCVP